MTPKIDTEKFLSLWERIWGELSPEWAAKFLSDPRIEKILSFSETSITRVPAGTVTVTFISSKVIVAFAIVHTPQT